MGTDFPVERRFAARFPVTDRSPFTSIYQLLYVYTDELGDILRGRAPMWRFRFTERTTSRQAITNSTPVSSMCTFEGRNAPRNAGGQRPPERRRTRGRICPTYTDLETYRAGYVHGLQSNICPLQSASVGSSGATGTGAVQAVAGETLTCLHTTAPDEAYSDGNRPLERPCGPPRAPA